MAGWERMARSGRLPAAELLEALAAREIRRPGRRSRVRWAAAGVEVLVEAHGSPTGSVRDAIVRAVVVT